MKYSWVAVESIFQILSSDIGLHIQFLPLLSNFILNYTISCVLKGNSLSSNPSDIDCWKIISQTMNFYFWNPTLNSPSSTGLNKGKHFPNNTCKKWKIVLTPRYVQKCFCIDYKAAMIFSNIFLYQKSCNNILKQTKWNLNLLKIEKKDRICWFLISIPPFWNGGIVISS